MTAILFLFALSLRPQEPDTRTEVRANLDECIRMALKNSHALMAQGHSIRVAETRLKQAKSGRYPSLDLTSAYLLSDEELNFIFPVSGIKTPPFNLGSVSLPSMEIDIPRQDIKMADNQNAMAELNLIWPLYTGGKVSSLVEQAKAGIAMAKCESSAGEDRIVYETKKLYYSVILASNLEKIAQTTHDRLNATLKITEVLYQEGSGKITKSDYLKNKVYVETARSLIHQISGEGENASLALAEAVGFDWPVRVAPADEEIPFRTKTEPVDSLMIRLKEKNPQIARVGYALDLYRAKIKETCSANFPTLALVGGYRRIISSYDYGLTTRQNKDCWTMGIGIRMNLFNGFRTGGMIDENKAVMNRILEQREMLNRGLELNLRVLNQRIEAAAEREKSMSQAVNAAVENSRIIERAYFSEMMELKDLLQAQITEAFIQAQYQMIRFEHADLGAQMDMLLARTACAAEN